MLPKMLIARLLLIEPACCATNEARPQKLRIGKRGTQLGFGSF